MDGKPSFPANDSERKEWRKHPYPNKVSGKDVLHSFSDGGLASKG